MNLLRALTSRSPASHSGKMPAGSDSQYAVHIRLYSAHNSELWLMAAVAALTGFVFMLTLSPGVCPGTSATATARALGLLAPSAAVHPLWLLAARAVAAVPLFDVVPRLNAFSALCGCLTAALLFRITKRMLFELIRDPPAIRLEPAADEASKEEAHDAPDAAADNLNAQLIASLGGLVAALGFAFSAPFWIASSVLHAGTFDLLLLLVAIDQLARYHYTSSTNACMAAVFLLGLGLVESVAFVSLAPLAIGLILLTAIRSGQISESFLLFVLATGLTGAAVNTALLVLLSDLGPASSASQVAALLAVAMRTHLSDLLSALPRTGWVLVIAQTVLPPLVAFTGVYRFSPLQDDPTRRKWVIGNILLTAFSVACLINAPYTAWALMRDANALPIIPALAIAVSAGALFAYWSLLATEHRYDADACHIEASLCTRLLGFGLCGLLGLMTIRALHTNFDDADGRQAAFADRIADALLAQTGSARCLLTDSTLDMNVLVRDHLAGRKRVILSVPADSAQSPAPAQAFVERWLHSAPHQAQQVASVASANVWLRAGLNPVPMGLVYTGAADLSALSCESLLATNRLFWREADTLLADAPAMRPDLRRVQARLREQLSRAANDFGVLAERLGDSRAADEAYGQALRLNPSNPCASLNRYGLRLRRANPAECVGGLAGLATQPGFLEMLDSTLATSGLLALQEADVLIPAILREYTAGKQPPEQLTHLLEKWLTVCRPTPPAPTAPNPSADPAVPATTSSPADSRIAQAIAMRLKGKSAAAERMLRLVVKDKPGNLSAWSLLAEILLNSGELGEVERTVLPAMRLACAQGDATLADMTEGCLRMHPKALRLKEARACFLRALSKAPSLSAASELLLRTDQLAGDAAQLEEDALLIVKESPGHATANALLGSLRLSQRRYADAEKHLRLSLACDPAAGALNDLAELLRQQGKLAEAEQQARLAIRLAPDLHQAWDTLGGILLDAGRTEEAMGPLRCAIAFGPTGDVRPHLTLTRVRIKEGRLQEAGAILDRVSPLPSQTAPTTLQEYAALRKQVADGRAMP